MGRAVRSLCPPGHSILPTAICKLAQGLVFPKQGSPSSRAGRAQRVPGCRRTAPPPGQPPAAQRWHQASRHMRAAQWPRHTPTVRQQHRRGRVEQRLKQQRLKQQRRNAQRPQTTTKAAPTSLATSSARRAAISSRSSPESSHWSSCGKQGQLDAYACVSEQLCAWEGRAP